jgi:DNA repair ATPase RecN
MTDRLARLRKLAGLQQTLKDFHEARNGSLLADAIRARRDAQEIAALADSGSPLAAMFTDVYARRIVAAGAEENESLRQAAIEARRAAAAGVRLKRVEETARKAESAVERAAQERDALERATRRSRDPK